MGVDTHGRWPLAAAALVGPASALALSRRSELRRDELWIAALAVPILLAHQSEEWVRPGGFLPFCNEQLLGGESPTWPLTERDGFHVNVTVGWSSALLGILAWRRSAAPAAAVLWLEAGNALMHTGMALRLRRYNPGLATATLLMAPHAVAGGLALRRRHRLSRSTGLAAAIAGIGFIAALPLAMKLRISRRPASL
jgi:hypothetical protein